MEFKGNKKGPTKSILKRSGIGSSEDGSLKMPLLTME
jgi:hypothetical protein